MLYLRAPRRLVLKAGKRFRLRLYPFSRAAGNILCLLLSAALLLEASHISGLIRYLQNTAQQSEIFDNLYIDPASVSITFPEEKRNLIYIYLESMETTFDARSNGGAMESELIPELYQLAKNNLNFSQNSGVGGFRAVTGATWTIGAMVAQTAGIPLKTPPGIAKNGYGADDSDFLPGVNSLTSILHENGYYQTLVVGSDSNFGGRRQYFVQHGLDWVYDLYTAWEDGIVPPDYSVWWGMEDLHLFEYARQELTEIAASGQPFAFTMLTVDTHHVGGYVCDICVDIYPEQYSNVLACSSRQVADFVAWIQQQDFYENTTIIICGDHPTMDSGYISRTVDSDYTRRVYNCIIHPAAETDYAKNREFCTLDLFPTTLAAIGCEIEGDRLGLGTNLFSGRSTLIEEMGFEAFDTELAKSSEYYMIHFYFRRD